jgi:tRNA A-37 threonylcarbamoyl transferase component Bud32
MSDSEEIKISKSTKTKSTTKDKKKVKGKDNLKKSSKDSSNKGKLSNESDGPRSPKHKKEIPSPSKDRKKSPNDTKKKDKDKEKQKDKSKKNGKISETKVEKKQDKSSKKVKKDSDSSEEMKVKRGGSNKKELKKYTFHDNLADDLCQSSDKVGKEDFELLTVIGRGSFGKVMQVKHLKTGKVYAMKVMRKDAIIAKNQVTHTIDEKHVLQKIQHPFIVKLHYSFQTKDKLYMIMDYVNGGELFFHLKQDTKFSESRVIFYAAEITSALIHLHSHGIIYRDLKPENILLDSTGHIVITDFGLSKEIYDGDTDTFCGTPEYLSPEVLKGTGHSYPVDWWSLGTLIYEMLVGLPPFYSKSINIMYQRILESPLRFPVGMSVEAMDILDKLLEREPDQRLCGPSIRDHPFFSSIDWDLLEAKKIEPPWKPPVTSPTDTGCIDPHFTNQDAADSLVPVPSWLADLTDEDKDLFEGFTFVGQGAIEGQSESE